MLRVSLLVPCCVLGQWANQTRFVVDNQIIEPPVSQTKSATICMSAISLRRESWPSACCAKHALAGWCHPDFDCSDLGDLGDLRLSSFISKSCLKIPSLTHKILISTIFKGSVKHIVEGAIRESARRFRVYSRIDLLFPWTCAEICAPLSYVRNKFLIRFKSPLHYLLKPCASRRLN